MTKRALIRILEREREAHAMERSRLLEMICHLAGKPTSVTDRDMWLDQTIPEPEEPQYVIPQHYADA